MRTSMILNYIPRLLQSSKIVQGAENEPAFQTYLHLMSAPGNNFAVPINLAAVKNSLPYP